MCSDECGACVLRNKELSYEDEILLNDDLSESSLAYAVPRDSYSNREGQGAESPAKSWKYYLIDDFLCISALSPVDAFERAQCTGVFSDHIIVLHPLFN